MVSVVIPNYNYEKYLSDRINSIINQSVSVSEIIFLDDASTDGSVKLAESILSKCGIPYKTIISKVNSGSVFKQWEKGIRECSSNYIWIAEADDSCHVDFIKTVLPGLVDNSGVGISYCETEAINDKNRIFSPGFYDIVHSRVDPVKWKSSYINCGQSEICSTLSIKNTIPNVSCLLFRKEAIFGILPLDTSYSFSGDWISYIRILEKWDISFNCLPLNYHRHHNNRTTSRFDNTLLFYKEALDIISYCNLNFKIPLESSCKALDNLLFQASLTSSLSSEILELIKGVFSQSMINDRVSLFFNKLALDNRNYKYSFINKLSRISIKSVLYKLWKKRV